MFTLIKCSHPGWEKTFETEEECRLELRDHICNMCMADSEFTIGANGEFTQDGVEPVPLGEDAPIGDLLSTACGCEFMVEQNEAGSPTVYL